MYAEGFESDLGYLKCTVEYPPLRHEIIVIKGV